MIQVSVIALIPIFASGRRMSTIESASETSEGGSQAKMRSTFKTDTVMPSGDVHDRLAKWACDCGKETINKASGIMSTNWRSGSLDKIARGVGLQDAPSDLKGIKAVYASEQQCVSFCFKKCAPKMYSRKWNKARCVGVNDFTCARGTRDGATMIWKVASITKPVPPNSLETSVVRTVGADSKQEALERCSRHQDDVQQHHKPTMESLFQNGADQELKDAGMASVALIFFPWELPWEIAGFVVTRPYFECLAIIQDANGLPTTHAMSWRVPQDAECTCWKGCVIDGKVSMCVRSDKVPQHFPAKTMVPQKCNQ